MSIITPNVFTLYQYTNRLNGKRYIGVTYKPIRRFVEHAKGKSGARAFNNAIAKYGIENFTLTILANFDDIGAAAYHEQAAILKFGTLVPGGYNLTAGAPGKGYGGQHSLETRARISLANMGHVPTDEARARMSTVHTGVKRGPHSDIHKAKFRAARLGHTTSPETRAKMSVAAKPRRASAETRAKMSASKMGNKNNPGRPLSDEHKAKISAALKGHAMSTEVRAKSSATQKGRNFSPETCAKMSAAHKKLRRTQKEGE